MTGVQTDWQPFTRPDVTVPTAMLDGIRDRTADAWVNIGDATIPHHHF